MYDIFLSYSTQDRERLLPLVQALEAQGWSVFWDHATLDSGDEWRRVIEREARHCRCLLVAWTPYSIESRWVREEADIGYERKVLIPIRWGEQVKPPFGFRELHARDFSTWDGLSHHPEFIRLVGRIEHYAVPSQQAKPSPTVKSSPLIVPPSPKPIRLDFEPEMVSIPAGVFTMGCVSGFMKKRDNVEGGCFDDEKPPRRVQVAAFALGKYPVTFDEFDTFCDATGKTNPNDVGWGRGQRSVIDVSWHDAMA